MRAAPWRPGRRRAGSRRARGRLRSRSDRRRAARRPRAARRWLAKTGSRSHSSTNASIPSRSSRSATRLVGGAPGAHDRPVGDARPTDSRGRAGGPTGVRDREPQRDPGAQRVPEDVRPALRPRASQDRGEVVGGPLDAGARRVGRDARAPVPGQVDDDDAEAPGERGRVRAPARPAAGEAVEQQQRDAGARAPDLPAEAVDDDAGHSRARAAGDGGGRLAVELHVAGAVRPVAQDPDAGPADRRRPARREVGRRDRPRTRRRAPSRSARRRCRGASRTAPRSARAARPSGASVVACGRNEKIPPPSLSTRTIVADRPCSRAATRALRSCRNETSPTTSATGPASAAAAPSAVDTTPSMPFAPRLDSGRIARSLAGQPVVHVPHRHAVAGPQQRPVGQRRRRAPRTAGPRTARRAPPPPRATSAAPRRRPDRPSHQPRRPSARRGRGRRCRARLEGIRQGVRRRRRVGVDEGRRDDRRVAPAAVTVDDDLRRAPSVRAGVSIGFEVGVAPNRITRSGRWASRHGPGRTRWSAWPTTCDRSCGPQRTPDSGSATIG